MSPGRATIRSGRSFLMCPLCAQCWRLSRTDVRFAAVRLCRVALRSTWRCAGNRCSVLPCGVSPTKASTPAAERPFSEVRAGGHAQNSRSSRVASTAAAWSCRDQSGTSRCSSSQELQVVVMSSLPQVRAEPPSRPRPRARARPCGPTARDRAGQSRGSSQASAPGSSPRIVVAAKLRRLPTRPGSAGGRGTMCAVLWPVTCH